MTTRSWDDSKTPALLRHCNHGKGRRPSIPIACAGDPLLLLGHEETDKAATKPKVCSSLLASFEGKQVEVRKTPTSMLCRGLSQLNSPIYELLGPSTVVLRRYDTPLLPSTLAVKHLGKSNAFRSLTSKSSPHAFRCKAGKQETDISYQLSTQSSINISQSLR
ncbi:hypothetical protein Q9966_013250 [Columba livia]|nr:hypothetical protein Q9966_013250 [Columba livia]